MKSIISLIFSWCFLLTLHVQSWAAARMPGSGDSSNTTPASYTGLLQIVPWIPVFAILYFLLIRPQQKQAKERQVMLDSVKRGDNILTQGGIYGVVTALKGPVIEVKLNEDTKVKMDKSAIARILREDSDPTKNQVLTPS